MGAKRGDAETTAVSVQSGIQAGSHDSARLALPNDKRSGAFSVFCLGAAAFALFAPLAEPGSFGAGSLRQHATWALISCLAAVIVLCVLVVLLPLSRSSRTLWRVLAALSALEPLSAFLSGAYLGGLVPGGSAFACAFIGMLFGIGEPAGVLAIAHGCARDRFGSGLGSGYAFLALGLAAVLAVPVVWLGVNAALSWCYLGVVSLAIPAGAWLSVRRISEPEVLSGEDGGAHDTVEQGSWARCWVRDALGTIWQPTVGMMLCFMSMLLPWQTFLGPTSLSVPALGPEPIGWALACVVSQALAARRSVREADVETAERVAMPVAAAMIVCLWIMGDISEIGRVASLAKGVLSGFVCASCFGILWIASSQGDAKCVRPGASASQALSLGLAFCALGSLVVIVVQATLGVEAASRIVPVASTLFLLVVCVDAILCLARMQRAHGAPRRRAGLSMEAAVRAAGESYGLSPRETQVLGQLVGGRTCEGIAEVLGISANTVRAHTRKIHEKLGVSSRDEIVALVEGFRDASAGSDPAGLREP
jgi:DNA-binding CsgD family transcriptional regulator